MVGEGKGMLIDGRAQRTLSNPAEVRGVGFFHGADVSLRFQPAEVDTGIVFTRTDLPDRPRVRASIENVIPTQRRTAIRQGDAAVEMIEHVMAALAGLRIDNCEIEIDTLECPGCDGSSLAFVEALDRAGTVEQGAPRKSLVLDRAITVRDGDSTLAAHPAEKPELLLSYHLDYGPESPISTQSYFVSLNPHAFRDQIASSRTFLLETEAHALRAAGIGRRATEGDLLIFGPDGVVGNSLRYADECARHKLLDMVGDLALLGMDLGGIVVAHRSGHKSNAALVRKLIQTIRHDHDADQREPTSRRINTDGTIDIQQIIQLLPHRYPFLLIDRVIEVEPGKRAVALKNVSINEPFFQGHWPSRPIMPGVLILEALAQTAGVLISMNIERTDRVALIASIDKVKLRRPVTPGDQLRLEVESRRIKSSTANVSALATVNGKVVAEAKIRFVIVDAARAA